MCFEKTQWRLRSFYPEYSVLSNGIAINLFIINIYYSPTNESDSFCMLDSCFHLQGHFQMNCTVSYSYLISFALHRRRSRYPLIGSLSKNSHLISCVFIFNRILNRRYANEKCLISLFTILNLVECDFLSKQLIWQLFWFNQSRKYISSRYILNLLFLSSYWLILNNHFKVPLMKLELYSGMALKRIIDSRRLLKSIQINLSVNNP